MSLLLNQQDTDNLGKSTVNERKVQFFKISSLVKIEDSTRS